MITDHTAKDGTPKIVQQCDLPLTGVGVVDRIITDRAVFDVVDNALVLRRMAPGQDIDSLRSDTAATFTIQLETADAVVS